MSAQQRSQPRCVVLSRCAACQLAAGSLSAILRFYPPHHRRMNERIAWELLTPICVNEFLAWLSVSPYITTPRQPCLVALPTSLEEQWRSHSQFTFDLRTSILTRNPTPVNVNRHSGDYLLSPDDLPGASITHLASLLVTSVVVLYLRPDRFLIYQSGDAFLSLFSACASKVPPQNADYSPA